MVRPALTGLATAYFRLFVLDSLAHTPGRPAALLARASAERLPIANGAFGRALQSLIEGGHVAPIADGAVALTALGAAERVAERERWSAVIKSALKLLGDADAGCGAAPAIPAPSLPRAAPVADAYLDRVLVATVRERVAAARDGGAGFAITLGALEVSHPAEATRRALVHRVIRAMLGGATTLLGVDVAPYRYGDQGVALLVARGSRGEDKGDLVAAVLRQRLEELLRSTTASVRAFSGARWRVRTGSATWSTGVPTTLALLRLAGESLARDEERSVA